MLVATLVGGPRSGLTTLALGGGAGWATFESSELDNFLPLSTEVAGVATYLVAGAVIVWVATGYREAIRSLNANERKRALLIRELQHRGANMLMVVQAVVSQTLRDDKEQAQKINDRIAALAATDELVTRSEDQTAALRDILSKELKPYGETRIALQGAPVNLTPELARSLGLICHELATNAAKYGAISRAEGQLSITWVTTDRGIQITWKESKGPPVSPPARQGFGTYFIERLLNSQQGRVELVFHPQGLVCEITLALSDKKQSRPLTSPQRCSPETAEFVPQK
jgi:two-component sensor histidine kinase